jgi:GNAT superfamily N-acetyltransferase
MTAVRKATHADVDRLGEVLARAFEDDPVIEWLLPAAASRRMERLAGLFRLGLRKRYLRHDEVWTTPDLAGGALWTPAGHWKMDRSQVIRSAPAVVSILRGRLPLGMRGLSMVEHRHPTEPHYYLGVLGADPARQRGGVGTALLTPVLDRCDRDGIGAYLESSKPENVPYYGRFGFEVREELTLPKGPKTWLMWRAPR